MQIINQSVYHYHTCTQVINQSVYLSNTNQFIAVHYSCMFQLASGMRGVVLSVPDVVKPVLSNPTCMRILLDLEFRLESDAILPPVDLPPTIDEIYWLLTALYSDWDRLFMLCKICRPWAKVFQEQNVLCTEGWAYGRCRVGVWSLLCLNPCPSVYFLDIFPLKLLE